MNHASVEVRTRNRKGVKSKPKQEIPVNRSVRPVRKKEDPYLKLRKAIDYFGFVAAIEVTNKSYNADKQEQVSVARDFLSSLVGEENKFVSGIALIKASKHALDWHPDFNIKIKEYDTLLFQKSCILALDSPFLTYEGQKCLEDFLEVSRNHRLGVPYLLEQDRIEKVRDIKAVVLEIYVAEMLRFAFMNSSKYSNLDYRLFTRQGYRYKDKQQKKDIFSGKTREMDIVVVSTEEIFKNILGDLRTHFSGIQTSYHPVSNIKSSSSQPYQK